MKCIHPVEHLVGTAEGIKCRLCGQLFPTFAELMKDRHEKLREEGKQEVEEVTEAPAEEAPKKKTAKKGAK